MAQMKLQLQVKYVQKNVIQKQNMYISEKIKNALKIVTNWEMKKSLIMIKNASKNVISLQNIVMN